MPKRHIYKALADARIEANTIINDTKLEMKAELAKKIADADLQIADRAKESEQKLNDIKAKATSSILDVANEIAIDIVAKVSPGPIDEKLIIKSVNQKVTE